MKHKNLFKVFTAVLFLGLLGMITACSNMFSDKASKATQIKPVLGNSERTVFPDFDIGSLYGIKLEAKANGSDGDFIELGIWDNVDTISPIDIKPGTYSFRLTAYQGEVSFISTKSRVEIEAGKVNPISFALKVNELGDVNSKGNINITVSWDASVKAISNQVTLYDVDSDGNTTPKFSDSNVKVYYDNDSKDGGWYIDYSKYDLPVGEYKFEFTVTDENYKQGFYSDLIVVAAECTSRNSFAIEYWSDMYAVASMAYTNESKHVTAEPDPDGNGIKITINYAEGDPLYWTDIRIRETVANIKKTYSIWNTENQDAAKMLGKDGLQEISFVYPFVENDENYIFNIELFGGDEKCSYAVYEIENVVTKAKGGNSSVLDADYKSKIQKAGVTLGTVGASMKLKTDLLKLFTDYTSLDSLVLDYRFHSGEKSNSDRNWNGCYQNFYCNLLDSVGMAEYKKLIDADSDGIFVTSEEALDVLKDEPVYFATADLYFATNKNDGSYAICLQSEETPYTIAKMNKISFVIDADTTETYLYPADTKVTFVNPTRRGFICEGVYKTADYSGSPITSLSKNENAGDITLYPKWAILFSELDWPGINKSHMPIFDLDADFNKTLKSGDTVALALTGTPNMDFEGKLRFQVYGKDRVTHRGDSEIYPRLTAGKEFTILFGLTINDENNGEEILPEDIFIQMEYDISEFSSQLVISDYKMTFEPDPIKYTYILTQTKKDGKYSEVETGYFVKDVKKELPVPSTYGMSFAGWYDNPDYTGSAVYSIPAADNTEKTLYAKWNLEFNYFYEEHDEHTTSFNLKKFQPKCDTIIELKEDGYTEEMLVLTGTSNIDFSGSFGIATRFYGNDENKTEFWGGAHNDLFKFDGESGHIIVNDIKAGVPFTVELPINLWKYKEYKAANLTEITPENLTIFLAYWDSDCQEIMTISDWKVELKPSVEFNLELDDDCWMFNDFEFNRQNNDALIQKYYVKDSTTPVTLPTTAYRDGYSRRFEGWYKDKAYTDGPYTEYVPAENTTLYAKWSLVFSEGTYRNGTDNSIHYNYGSWTYLNSFAYWQDKEKNEAGEAWGNKPNLKKGDHVTIVLKGTPTANTDMNDYVIGGQLWDTNHSVCINDFHSHNKIVEGEPIELIYDFDINWEDEVNYEDLSVDFVYDTGKVKAHADGVGLILSDYSISYNVCSDKVTVTYDYGYETRTEQVYKDNWFSLAEAELSKVYDGRIFQGWYEDSDYSGDRIYSACLDSSKTYYAKWQYKLAEGGHIDGYTYTDDDGVLHYGENYHKQIFTYESRINNREVINKLGYTSENMPEGRYWVVVFRGISDADIDGVYGQTVRFTGEYDDYQGDYSNTIKVTKDEPFRLISKIDLGRTMNFETDKLDLQFGKSSLIWNEHEPLISDLSYEVFAYENEADADAKIKSLKPVAKIGGFTIDPNYAWKEDGTQDKTKLTNYQVVIDVTNQTGLLGKYDEFKVQLKGVSNIDIPEIFIRAVDNSPAAGWWKEIDSTWNVTFNGSSSLIKNVVAGEEFTAEVTLKLCDDPVGAIALCIFYEKEAGSKAVIDFAYETISDAAGDSCTDLPACSIVTDKNYDAETPEDRICESAKLVTYEGQECVRIAVNESNEIRGIWLFDEPVDASTVSTLSFKCAGADLVNNDQGWIANFILLFDSTYEKEQEDGTIIYWPNSTVYPIKADVTDFVSNTITLSTDCVYDTQYNPTDKIIGIQIFLKDGYSAIFVKDLSLN